MKKFISITTLICLFSQVSVLHAQLKFNYSAIAGPNISNVVTRWDKVPIFFAIESPFFSVNYLVGASVETKIRNRVYLSSDLFYEKISNASEGFNKIVTENNDVYNFINISLGLSAQPIKDRDYRIDIGLIGSYEIIRRGFRRSYAGSIYTGIQLPITKKISFRTRMSYGIPDINFNTSSIVSNSTIDRSMRIMSFQFTLAYKILKL